MLRLNRLNLGAAVGTALVLVFIDPGTALVAVAEAVDLRPVALTRAGKVN